MLSPKISIITPSYNQGKFIEETILSVISQGYPNLEYIIIDGGSTDETVSIIKKYEKNISYWVSEKDNGQSDAINKGFKMATGEIVAWLNSDDLYEDDTLFFIAGQFAESPDVDFIFGDCLFFGDNYRHLNKILIDNFQAKQLGQFPYSQPSCFFKKKLLDDYGMLDTRFHYCLDVDLFIRFALNCNMRYVAKELSKFRLHEESKTNTHWQRFLDEWVIIYNKTLRTIENEILIDFAKKLNIYHAGDDKYDKYTKTIPLKEQYKSFKYFLERQLHRVFPGERYVVNAKRLNVIEQYLQLLGDEQASAAFPIREHQYLLGFNKHLFNPANLLRIWLGESNTFKALVEKSKALSLKYSLLVKGQVRSPKKIPIIIINYNQLATLQLLLNWLNSHGYHNIHVIDNNSNYPPLLKFYEDNKINVISLKTNKGHMVLWNNFKLLKKFNKGYYAVTDPDIIPQDSCPDDFMAKFLSVLNNHPEVTKVGFSLKIDDIPDYYPMKESVIAWENKFWTNKVEDDLYSAEIDTTFALYRPKQNVHKNFYSAIRVGEPYVARHISWYQDPNNLSAEQQHYNQTSNQSNTWFVKKSDINYQDF